MSQQGKRNSSLDVLKGIGIISMVMGHSNMGSLFEIYIAGFHMQLFFIISGFLYKPERYPRFNKYLKRKLTTIVVPYLFFAIITIIVCQVINIVSDHEYFTWNQYFRGILFGNQAIFPITGAIWFLQSIFWIEIAYYFIEKIKSDIGSSIVILALLGASVVLSINNISLPFSMDSALSGIVFYHIGFLLSKTDLMNRAKWLRNPHVAIWLIVFLLNIVMIYVNRTVNPRTCEYSFVPLYYINAVVGTWCWYIIVKFVNTRGRAFLIKITNIIEYIGLNSIVFLGINQLVIKGLYIAINQVIPVDLGVIRAGRNIVICILTLCICALIAFLFTKTPLCVLIGKKYSKSKTG